jgi:hypothetical protein
MKITEHIEIRTALIKCISVAKNSVGELDTKV